MDSEGKSMIEYLSQNSYQNNRDDYDGYDYEEDELSVRESMDNKHWVEELFPPAFGFTIDELLADIGKPEEPPELTTFDKYARRVTPLDTSAIKNVYERVWLMQSLENDAMNKSRVTQGDTLRASFTLTRGEDMVEVRDAETSTVDLLAQTADQEEAACIWSQDEIGVLREVFQAARQQNKLLKATSAEVNERYDAMKIKHKKQQTTLDSTTRKLHEAVKSNSRLYILTQNLNAQLKAANDKIDFLRRQIESFKKDRELFEQQAHEAKLALDKERLERQSAEITLQQQTKQALHKQMIHEETFKSEHQLETSKLRKRVQELETALEAERQDHLRSKRGLEHLRTHFASLPYAEDIQRTNMVVEDQLTKWTI